MCKDTRATSVIHKDPLTKCDVDHRYRHVDSFTISYNISWLIPAWRRKLCGDKPVFYGFFFRLKIAFRQKSLTFFHVLPLSALPALAIQSSIAGLPGSTSRRMSLPKYFHTASFSACCHGLLPT